MNKSLRKIIIIDNSPSSYILNKNNAIPIKTWINNKNDCELHNLIPVLETLSFADDVTKFIPKFIENNMLDFNKFNQIKSKIVNKPILINSSRITEKKNKTNINYSKILSENSLHSLISPEKEVYLPDPQELHLRAKKCIEQIDKLNYDFEQEETPKKPKESKIKTVGIYLFSKDNLNKAKNKSASSEEIVDKKIYSRPSSSRFLNYNIKISFINKKNK